jgi:glutathione S-transferase
LLRHNIDDERQAMKSAFEEFLHAKGDRPFLGGDIPNLADLALYVTLASWFELFWKSPITKTQNRYGAINSFAGCATFIEMRADTSGIAQWYDEMRKAVAEHRGAQLLAEKCKNLEQMSLD